MMSDAFPMPMRSMGTLTHGTHMLTMARCGPLLLLCGKQATPGALSGTPLMSLMGCNAAVRTHKESPCRSPAIRRLHPGWSQPPGPFVCSLFVVFVFSCKASSRFSPACMQLAERCGVDGRAVQKENYVITRLLEHPPPGLCVCKFVAGGSDLAPGRLSPTSHAPSHFVLLLFFRTAKRPPPMQCDGAAI